MIYVTGDTHGEYGRILEFDKKLKKDDAIIVCGDFGFIFHNDEKEKQVLNEIEKRSSGLYSPLLKYSINSVSCGVSTRSESVRFFL